MAILSGRRPGPYEILSAIVSRGMAEVYKAREPRPDRSLAIKILPTHFLILPSGPNDLNAKPGWAQAGIIRAFAQATMSVIKTELTI